MIRRILFVATILTIIIFTTSISPVNACEIAKENDSDAIDASIYAYNLKMAELSPANAECYIIDNKAYFGAHPDAFREFQPYIHPHP